jgi:hypothetical protein
MTAAAAVLAAYVVAGALAHFQLQYPAPRGEFVEDSGWPFPHVHQRAPTHGRLYRGAHFL